MHQGNLLKRTKLLAISIIRFIQSLPKNGIIQVIGRQLLRSGTSVGANYRSVCMARYIADFIAKISNSATKIHNFK